MDLQQGNKNATAVMDPGDVKHWMTSYHAELSPLKLHELMIPSTLHSGIFGYGAQHHESKEPAPSESPWEFQIEAGIRALDLRIYQTEVGQWVFHYATLPSEHSVQSLIDWCNAYYSASDSTGNKEIIIFNIRDCYSVNDDFDYEALKNFFVNGLRSTSLIPRSAALLSLGEIHQAHPGKNIVLSWDKCIDDNLIWPYRWQTWIRTVVPASMSPKQMYLIHNAITECTTKLFVANACFPALSYKQTLACSTLDHERIQACLNANIEKAPPLAPVIEEVSYDFTLRLLYLLIRPHFKTSHYQIYFPGMSEFYDCPYASFNGFDEIKYPFEPDKSYVLSIRSRGTNGVVSKITVLDVDTATPEPISGPGNPNGPDGPEVRRVSRTANGSGRVEWAPNDNYMYHYLLGKIYLLKDINGGIATGPAVFEEKLDNKSGVYTTPPLEWSEIYVVTLVGLFYDLKRTKATWHEI